MSCSSDRVLLRRDGCCSPQSRGCPLRGLLTFPDIPTQVNRFLSAGWQHSSAVDMNFIYNSFLPRARVARADKAEIFDEFEEWNLISEHYCMALAVNDRDAAAKADGCTGDAAPSGSGAAAAPASHPSSLTSLLFAMPADAPMVA